MTFAPTLESREEPRYNAPFVASLTKIDSRTVRKWLAATVGATDLASFLDVVELRIVRRLSPKKHFGAKRLLAMHAEAKDRSRSQHPFASQRVLREPKTLSLWLTMDDGPPVHLGYGGQTGFAGVVRNIAKELEWDRGDDLAARLNPADDVVIDPEVRWGQPIVKGTRILTATIFDAFYAYEGNAAQVAVLYGLTEEQVRSAIAFERTLAAA